jgi:hypothetical protein
MNEEGLPIMPIFKFAVVKKEKIPSRFTPPTKGKPNAFTPYFTPTPQLPQKGSYINFQRTNTPPNSSWFTAKFGNRYIFINLCIF